MTAICESAIHLCAIRATRLDQVGHPLPGPHNVYITDNVMMLTVRPEIEAGQDRVLVGGCDCIVAQYRGPDKLKRFNLELDLGQIEPGLLEMLLGGDAITEADGDPIGMWWATQIQCSQPQQPNIAFEGWQTLWDVDHASDVGGYRYLHWLWPSTFWQIGDNTLQNDFLQPKLTGFSRGNANWGMGIFGDLPEESGEMGGFFYDETIPVARCGWQTFPVT